MEVIPINTNDNAVSKADLWADRFHAFQESGLSRKEWCQQNGIPQSTLGYWIRKLQSEASETESASDPVFAKLPSEHELHFSTAGTGTPPVMICLPENIRIEVAADCPARLLTALLQALKNYARFFRKYYGLSGMWLHGPPEELHWFSGHHQTEIPSRSVLPLYVRVLQSQAHIAQDTSVGRVRVLDPDETAGPRFLPLA